MIKLKNIWNYLHDVDPKNELLTEGVIDGICKRLDYQSFAALQKYNDYPLNNDLVQAKKIIQALWQQNQQQAERIARQNSGQVQEPSDLFKMKF